MAFLLYWTFQPLNRIGMPTYKRNIYICESHHGSWTCLTFKENYVRRPCMLHVAMWCNPEIHLNFFMLRLCMLVKSRISFCTFPWRKELQVPLFYLTSITLTKVDEISTFSSLHLAKFPKKRLPSIAQLARMSVEMDRRRSSSWTFVAEGLSFFGSWQQWDDLTQGGKLVDPNKRKAERKKVPFFAMNFEVFFHFFHLVVFFWKGVNRNTWDVFFETRRLRKIGLEVRRELRVFGKIHEFDVNLANIFCWMWS